MHAYDFGQHFPQSFNQIWIHVMNVVVLRGTLQDEPLERTLSSGVTVTNWEVRAADTETVQTVPVQWEDADRRVQAITAGDEGGVLGTIRRRFFRTGGATAARTEVLGAQMAKPTQRKAMAKVLNHAQAALATEQ